MENSSRNRMSRKDLKKQHCWTLNQVKATVREAFRATAKKHKLLRSTTRGIVQETPCSE
jgi:hypothetical protein